MTIHKLVLTSFGVIAMAAGLAAADKPKLEASKLPPAASKTGLTYDHDIKPLVEKSCLKCHSGEKPKGKYRADTKENLMKGGENGDPAVVTGKSAESLVVYYSADLIADMEMPPLDKRDKYPALTKDEIGLLRAWIDQGAK